MLGRNPLPPSDPSNLLPLPFLFDFTSRIDTVSYIVQELSTFIDIGIY